MSFISLFFICLSVLIFCASIIYLCVQLTTLRKKSQFSVLDTPRYQDVTPVTKIKSDTNVIQYQDNIVSDTVLSTAALAVTAPVILNTVVDHQEEVTQEIYNPDIINSDPDIIETSYPTSLFDSSETFVIRDSTSPLIAEQHTDYTYTSSDCYNQTSYDSSFSGDCSSVGY